jgi:transcription-repair coupling factor (superfamily II helicase)
MTEVSFQTGCIQNLHGCPEGFDSMRLAEWARQAGARGLIHIATDDLRAALLADAVRFFAPDLEILTLPAWDCLPYDRVSPSVTIIGQRMATLATLTNPTDQPRLIITTVAAAAQLLPPKSTLAAHGLVVRIGMNLSMERLQSVLALQGYHRTATAREAGDYACRGDIIDVYPAGGEEPVRIDFIGDQVEALRRFDPLTQISAGALSEFALLPISEILLDDAARERFRSGYRDAFGAVLDDDPLYAAISSGRPFAGVEHWLPLFHSELVSLFDFLPTAVISRDAAFTAALTARHAQIEDFYQARRMLWQSEKTSKQSAQKSAARGTRLAAVYKPILPAQLYLAPAALQALLSRHAVLQLSAAATSEDTNAKDLRGRLGRDFAPERVQGQNLFQACAAFIKEEQKAGRRVMLACVSQGSCDRLRHMAKEQAELTLHSVEDRLALGRLPENAVGIAILALDRGFSGDGLTVIAETDFLGERLIRKPRRQRASEPFRMELSALNLGDAVVHRDHGVGRYEGLETLQIAGQPPHDCLKLVYEGGDKLYLPVENLDLVSRYGSETGAVTLDRLGSAAWQARKARVKKRLKDMADALLAIAAQRATRHGEVIATESGSYDEFCARFPYMETEDQAQAIRDVATDLASGKPMDRLICGDVGFGKTEVALRSAFLAAQYGLQVAVVVPTTLLARQHSQNFNKRFAGFPFRIGQLSRFTGAKETVEIKTGLQNGSVQIVIGTHALLAKDIAFRNLGLVIIDEEQHFGVKQKEKLKQLRSEVHVLTLTATPIPRTLQLALAGVRELSLITTPPIDRLAVRSFVLPYDPLVVREAIMREHFRGGQIYYVCPRIEDLSALAAELRELVPEVRLVVAHGKLAAGELDDVMTAFDAGQYDILLATNIIESGLDIPNANTLIIHRADMFGLSQLYQLRGRVGRGKQRGYAYFTTPPQQILSTAAQQRLQVIETLDQLGAGFQLASHDLDQRGSGNLLGEEQSGHIREVGMELYQQMLEDAIAAARGQSAPTDISRDWIPQINLGLPVLIPETYVADLHLRLGLYRRAAELTTAAEIDSFAAELTDRFGTLPPEVENLLQTIAIKQICKQAQIARLDAGDKGAVLGFHQDKFGAPEKLIGWLTQQAGTAKLRPDHKLVLIRSWDSDHDRLRGLRKSLTQLASLAA